MGLNLEQEEHNRKIIDMIANLGTLGGDTTALPSLESCNSDVLFPEEFYGTELNEEAKQHRSKYLVLRDFLLAKKLEGCSNNTIKLYYDCIYPFIATINKEIPQINTSDIRSYLNMYHESHDIQKATMDNMRRIFSSFFEWLSIEDYTMKNPVKKIKRIKVDKTIKKPFTDEDIVKLRDATLNLRDLTIVDLLYSSGVRVSELCSLNTDDINLVNKEGIVFGKGAKERIIYFDARTKVHIQHYLASRIDDNPALFVALKYPFKRLKKSGVEVMIRDCGFRAGVDNAHPHRFRRTFATNLINKGVPIEQVQRLLGHTKIDTTLIYAQVNQDMVKINHERYV